MDRKRRALATLKELKAGLRSYYLSYAGVTGGEKGDEKELMRGSLRLGGELLKRAAFVILGSLFGSAQALLGSYPFGIGLLCAAKKYTVYIYAGLVAAAIFSGGEVVSMLAAASVSFGIRFIFVRFLEGGAAASLAGDDSAVRNKGGGDGLFREAVGFRLAAAVMGAFAGGIIRVVFGGFLFYDLFGTMFQMVAAPAVTFLLYGIAAREKRYTVFYEAGICAAGFIFVWSLRSMTLFGFSLSPAVAFFLTMYAAMSGGMLRGGTVGLICGLACGFTEAPAVAVAGLVYGLLSGLGKLASVAGAAVSCVALNLLMGGTEMLWSFSPDILASAVLFAPLAFFGLLPKLPLYGKASEIPDSVANGVLVADYRRSEATKKFAAVSGAFSALSSVCYTLSQKSGKPGIYETRMLCTDVFDASCRHCAGNTVCFDKRYESMAEAIDVIARRLIKNGRIDRSDLPEAVTALCEKPQELTDELNLRFARLSRRTAESDKTEVFAADYDSVSKILDAAAKESDSEYNLDRELSGRVSEAVGYMDFYACNVAVFGNRHLRVVAGGVDLARVRVSPDELQRAVENVCGRKLGAPEFHIENEYVSMTLEAVPVISVESSSSSLEKKNETVCGDSSVSFARQDGYSYLLISDGMGSGHEAAITSRVASTFLRRMLEAGCSLNSSLELLNNFIRSRNVECFATVDLIEIDTLRSEAKFIKSGAAPSYVIRNGSLFKIASGTVPVGITREISAEQIKFRLEKDDVVIMVSDGVAQTLEESAWLADVIISGWEDDIEKLGKKILDAATERNKRRDDMTVGLLKITAA